MYKGSKIVIPFTDSSMTIYFDGRYTISRIEGCDLMKKNVVIVVLGLLVLGLGGYIVYDILSDKTSKNSVEKNEQSDKIELKEDLTLEKITTLANDEELHLQKEYITEFNTCIGDDSCSADKSLVLKIDANGLTAVYKNKILKVSDLDEKVIAMSSAQNSCDVLTMEVLFITEKGNIYILYRNENNNTIYDGEYEEKSEFIKKLESATTEIKLGLVKLNDEEKVIALSTYRGDSRGMTCGTGTTVAYMANGEYRYVMPGMAKKYDNHIDEAYVFEGPGFLIYPDNKLSITGESLLKNKKGEDLIFKKIFLFGYNDEIGSDFIIVDKNDDIYISTLVSAKNTHEYAVDKVKLYSDKVNFSSHELKKITCDSSGDAQNYIGASNLAINLSNNTKLEIDLEETSFVWMMENGNSSYYSVLNKCE